MARLSVVVALAVLSTLAATTAAREFDADIAVDDENTQFHFGRFVEIFNKSYTNDAEMSYRSKVFADNWASAVALNKAEVEAGGNAVYGMSPFADLTPTEFAAGHLTDLTPSEPIDTGALVNYTVPEGLDATLASSLDLCEKGLCTPVKNQGRCGSCWAFSATETAESAIARAGHGLRKLSVEEVADCDSSRGCNGGDPRQALQWIAQHGLEAASSYPYTAGNGRTGFCKRGRSRVDGRIGRVGAVNGEGSLRGALHTFGPVSISVDASQWQMYSRGVVTNCGRQLDHAVQAVGYGPGYWLVRNSWGQQWGERGFILLASGRNTCGLGEYITYATA